MKQIVLREVYSDVGPVRVADVYYGAKRPLQVWSYPPKMAAFVNGEYVDRRGVAFVRLLFITKFLLGLMGHVFTWAIGLADSNSRLELQAYVRVRGRTTTSFACFDFIQYLQTTDRQAKVVLPLRFMFKKYRALRALIYEAVELLRIAEGGTRTIGTMGSV